MATYDISVHCKDCGKDHPVLLTLDLDGGPDGKHSVAELFHGRPLPPQLATIRWHSAFCYKTGRKFRLESDDEIFLVAPLYFRRYSLHDRRRMTKLDDPLSFGEKRDDRPSS
jgi:hypothetical protein